MHGKEVENMNLQHLKYVSEVAKTKSISKAAENLYMGQPNLSRAIKELEDSLGIIIFERSKHGISITPDGEEFLMYAKRILHQVDEVESIYKNAKTHKQRFSICVPRASYISEAFTRFAASIKKESPAEIFYKETNSMRTINNLLKEEYDLGIVRYQAGFDEYYNKMFTEKNIAHELITEFSYMLIASANSPLAAKKSVVPQELAEYIEVCHADPYVPSLPLIDVKKAELSEYVDKRIFVFERGSQFDLLENVPNTFMWVSPMPKKFIEKYNLVSIKCETEPKIYKDVLIYRRDYKMSRLDNEFINSLCAVKREIFK